MILYWPKQTSLDLLQLDSIVSPIPVLLYCLINLVLLPLDEIIFLRLTVLDYPLPRLVVVLLLLLRLGIFQEVPLVLQL